MSLNPEDDDGLELAPPAEAAWPPAEFELILRKPVEKAEGGELRSIMLREPTGSEWEDIMAHAADTRRRYAVSVVGGVPMKVCAKIGIGDLVRGEAYLTSFFDVGQAIGAR